MDEATVSEFATGVIGIGALFFAYGQVPSDHTRTLIALVGLGGSVILWMHLYSVRKEFRTVRQTLKSSPFMKALYDVQSWRKKGWNRRVYYPVSRLMTYFMGLVSWAWVAIILRRLNWFSFENLLIWSSVIILITIGLTLVRQVQDIKRPYY